MTDHPLPRWCVSMESGMLGGMEAIALLGALATVVLAVIGGLAGLAVLRLEKMKVIEHEIAFGDPAAADVLRRKHAARVAKVGVRRAVAQTTVDLRG